MAFVGAVFRQRMPWKQFAAGHACLKFLGWCWRRRPDTQDNILHFHAAERYRAYQRNQRFSSGLRRSGAVCNLRSGYNSGAIFHLSLKKAGSPLHCIRCPSNLSSSAQTIRAHENPFQCSIRTPMPGASGSGRFSFEDTGEAGNVYTAQIEGDNIVDTGFAPGQLTREQVEAKFADVAGC
jgi:hypothetical protein